VVYGNNYTASDPSQGTLLGQETRRDTNHFRCRNIVPALIYIYTHICLYIYIYIYMYTPTHSGFTCWCPTRLQSPWGSSKLLIKQSCSRLQERSFKYQQNQTCWALSRRQKKTRNYTEQLVGMGKILPIPHTWQSSNQPFHLQHKKAGN